MRAPGGVWVVVVAACGFNPAGGGDDDGPPDDAMIDADEGDARDGDAATIDAADVDAADVDAATIDAATIDAPPTDAPLDARPMCPASYNVTFQGSRYRFGAIAVVWSVAAADCDDDLPGRTHLATFEVASQMDGAISAVNPGNSAEPLVGATCNAADCATTSPWIWVGGGAAVSASLWASGQPDNGTTEKAGAAIREMGTWKLQNVTTSLTTRPFICECDP